MPSAITNSAAPPNTASPVWAMYSNAPANGAATQGPTMMADRAPITATPPSVPPLRWLAVSDSRLCSAAGICSS